MLSVMRVWWQYFSVIGSCVLSTSLLAQSLANLPGHAPFLPIDPTQSVVHSRLPIPVPMNPAKPDVLSLRSAVLLALHHNPELQVAFNNRKLQRYDLAVAEEQFRPQFSLASTLQYQNYQTDSATFPTSVGGNSNSRSETTSGTLGPEVDWTLPLGTKISANWNYNPSKQTGSIAGTDNHSTTNTYTVTITQPLLKNFGFAVNEVGLHNAQTNQIIDNLQLADKVASTISQITTDYYAVVQAKASLNIAKATLDQSKRTLFIRKNKLKAGQISGTDVTQAQLDITTQQQAVVTAQQKYNTARTTLMNDLGLPSNTVFKVDDKIDVQQIPASLQSAMPIAQKNNRTLKIALLQHKIAQRNVLTSENDNRWELDLQLSTTKTRASTVYDDQLNTISSNNIVTANTVGLNLTIPLNHITMDQKSLSTAIALENDQITLRNARRTLKSNLQTAIENLHMQWNQLRTSQENLTLAKKNYHAAQIKFQYGRIDAFTLSQQQQQLVTAQNSVVSAKIAYLTQTIAYQKLLGTLLKQWHIKLEAKNHV